MNLSIVCIKSIRNLVVGNLYWNLYYYDRLIYHNNGERILYAIFDSGNIVAYLSFGQIEFNFISLSECMRELDVLEKNFNFFMDHCDLKIFEK